MATASAACLRQLQFGCFNMVPLTRIIFSAGCAKQELVYELKAVLIHRGPSANSGHYVAHIYDQAAGNWYKFNDEEVQQIKGKTLKLGLEEDPLGNYVILDSIVMATPYSTVKVKLVFM